MKRIKRTWIVAAAVACCAPSFAQTSSPPGSILGVAGGRFAMGQISSFRRDQFMIDTQSGRAWELVCMKVPETDANGCSLWGLRPLVYLDAVGTPVGVTPSAAPAGR